MSPTNPTPYLNRVYRQDLKHKVSSQFNNPKYSDLTVTCGEATFHVHKVICCAHSTFFDACCSADMLEKRTGKIDLTVEEDCEGEVIVVEAMLKFFYTFDYDDTKKEESEATIDDPMDDSEDGDYIANIATQSVLFNAKVYTMAEEYGCLDLSELARLKFETAVQKHWNTEEFADAVRYVYEQTPAHGRELRQVIAHVIWDNIDVLGAPEGLLERLPEEVWGVGKDLIVGLPRKMNEWREQRESMKMKEIALANGCPPVKKCRCPHCRKDVWIESLQESSQHCPSCGRSYVWF